MLIAPEGEGGMELDGGSGFYCAHAACTEDRLDRVVLLACCQAAGLKPPDLDDVRWCVRSEHRF